MNGGNAEDSNNVLKWDLHARNTISDAVQKLIIKRKRENLGNLKHKLFCFLSKIKIC